MRSDQKQQFSRYSAPVIELDNHSSAKSFAYFTPWLFVFTLIWLAGYATIFPDPIGLAASNWPLIIVGVFGAFIATLPRSGAALFLSPCLCSLTK